MTENKIIKRLNDTLTSLKEELEAILEEIAEKKEEEFKPKYGDKYWVVGGDGEPDVERWDDHFYDKEALGNNATFETYEEAKFEAERLKVLRELEKMGRAFKPFHDNYMIIFSHDGGLTINGYSTTAVSYGNYYFDDSDEVWQAIKKIGEERIKKYLFGLED